MPDFPEKLKFLLDGSHTKSSSFRQHIPVSIIQGQIYYQINTALYIEEGENLAIGQIFIYDENEALEHRLKQNTTLDIEILNIL